MLMLNRIFNVNWSSVTPPPDGFLEQAEFWTEAITRVRQAFPKFLLIAEVYWNLEAELQQLGFDFTYDKRLLDFLHKGNVAGIRKHALVRYGHGASFHPIAYQNPLFCDMLPEKWHQNLASRLRRISPKSLSRLTVSKKKSRDWRFPTTFSALFYFSLTPGSIQTPVPLPGRALHLDFLDPARSTAHLPASSPPQ